MMPINPIIAAAVADMLTGMIIYSDFAFGSLWSRVSGIKCSTMKDTPVRFAAQFVASLMSASALYIAILTFKKTDMPYSQEMFTRIYSWFIQDANMLQADFISSLKIAGFFWLGFVVPMIICSTVWSQTINWQKGALKSIFSLVHMLAMAATLAYFG